MGDEGNYSAKRWNEKITKYVTVFADNNSNNMKKLAFIVGRILFSFCILHQKFIETCLYYKTLFFVY